MKKTICFLLVAAALVVMAPSRQAAATPPHTVADLWSARFARVTPWHGNYYYTQWGRPVPLVVPPTAHMKTRWSWGVAQNEMVPIHHRFARPYPGYAIGADGMFLPTPYWPSHTDQFGVYYVRGPWE